MNSIDDDWNDDDGWGGRPVQPPRPHRTAGPGAIASVLVIVNAVLAVLSAISGLFNLFAYDRCADTTLSCNYDVGVPALWVLIAFNVVVWVAAVVITASRWKRRWPPLWVQCAAFVLLIAGWFAYVAIINHATGA